MRKISILSISVFISLAATAQTINIHYKNGQLVELNSDEIDYVDFSEKASDPTLTSGEAVDLGLSVLWASCNVGASTPEEFGNFYAWGETSTKDSYTKQNYTYYDSNNAVYVNIGKEISGTDFDAAKVNLGNGWRMPTSIEANELVENCTWTWTQVNGVNGYQVTGNNGNSIFIPASGEDNVGWHANENFYLWTGSSENQYGYASYLHGTSSYYGKYSPFGSLNHIGWPIRPVKLKESDQDTSDADEVRAKISAAYIGGAVNISNDLIRSGSQLNWSFINGSEKKVTLIGMQLIDGSTGNIGSNMMSKTVEVDAGATVSYAVTIGSAGIRKPSVRFTYRYGSKEYYVEAEYKEF